MYENSTFDSLSMKNKIIICSLQKYEKKRKKNKVRFIFAAQHTIRKLWIPHMNILLPPGLYYFVCKSSECGRRFGDFFFYYYSFCCLVRKSPSKQRNCIYCTHAWTLLSQFTFYSSAGARGNSTVNRVLFNFFFVFIPVHDNNIIIYETKSHRIFDLPGCLKRSCVNFSTFVLH